MKKGFTLIELLVVVLIIGVLTAIALPHYQAAVIKSRAAELLVWAKTIEEAQVRYFLANGTYTANLALLDIKLPPRVRQVRTLNSVGDDVYVKPFAGSNSWQGNFGWAYIQNKDIGFFVSYPDLSDRNGGVERCFKQSSDYHTIEPADRVCKSLGFTISNGSSNGCSGTSRQCAEWRDKY